MYNNMSYENYVLYKMFLSIIFNPNKDILKECDWICEIDSLVALKKVIEYLKNNNMLSRDIKGNIYNYLGIIRDIKDEYKVKRNIVIGEMIQILNLTEDTQALDFYQNEIYKRRSNIKHIFSVDPRDILSNIELINTSIQFDTEVLLSHSKFISEDIFDQDYLELFANNVFYYESLSALLYEYPGIFKDELFYNRILKVFNYAYSINKNKYVYKENKNYIKKINKCVKQV